MHAIMSSMSKSLPNMAWKIQTREEDLNYREELHQRRKIEDARRSVDEKMEQLKALAEISMIIAGFTISALCEISVPDSVDPTTLSLFGFFTSSTIAITTISGLISTFLLVGVYKYDTLGHQRFEDFWAILFENDWKIAFKSFVLGNFFFMLSLIQGSWVLYYEHEYGSVAAGIVTVICVLCMFFWYIRIYKKWANTLEKGHTKLQGAQTQGNTNIQLPPNNYFEDEFDGSSEGEGSENEETSEEIIGNAQ